MFANFALMFADVKDIKCVINYDFPKCLEDYIHRIGRTGRAVAKSKAFTFLTDKNAKIAKELTKILREAGQVVSPSLAALARSSYSSYSGGGIDKLLGFLCKRHLQFLFWRNWRGVINLL
ncbi:hypothetical protein MKX01_033942 [Papaver californicum]|nr:hypothetical protein MKX01_033942 [Papaver californicum]